MRSFRLVFLCVALMLSGCATQGVLPQQVSVDKVREFSAPYDEVWAAIIASIAETNIGITTLAKDSGLIAMSNIGYDPIWAYEGTRGSVLGTPDLVEQRIANFNILATSVSEEKTQVQVNSNFRMLLRTGNGSMAFPFQRSWVQTYSKGTLEAKILDSVAAKIRD
nr:hypothetical protein [uncultured Desulfuromonas sp.]